MDFQHAGLDQREQPIEVLDREHLLAVAVGDDPQIAFGQAGRCVLLEEAFALGAVRTAHQRKRPADHMRGHPVPDRGVIVGQVLFGDADFDPVDPIRMGEAHVAVPP